MLYIQKQYCPASDIYICSLYHQEKDFDTWWERNSYKYGNITKEEFKSFPVHNGIIKGIGMPLRVNPEPIVVGDIPIYRGDEFSEKIAHRVIDKWQINGSYYFEVLGDNNPASETVTEEMYYGKWVSVFPEFVVRDGCERKRKE